MKYKIHSITFSEGSRGWCIDALLSVPTHRQFSNEHPSVSNYGFDLKPSNSIIISALKFWLKMRGYVKRLQSIPGDYDL
jgi:hypothetical protein